MLAVVDTGPLVAAADARDPDHQRSLDVLSNLPARLFVPILVIGEATYIIGRKLGPRAEADFLAGLSDFVVEAPISEDWLRMADLVRTYQDFPLGTTDASAVVLAERLNTDIIVTLDQRHFGAVRPHHIEAFRLLPE